MGYTIKQKIEICLKSENNPKMTQSDLAKWAQQQYKSEKQPSQTTISRILSNKNDLIASKEADFQLVRRRKKLNPILRQILTEWVTQSIWEKLPITTPIIQSTANSIWTRLPLEVKDGNGIFNQKWCNQFMKKLNVNLVGSNEDINDNFGYKLNKIWQLDEKLDLKNYLKRIISKNEYKPQDIFTIDEFQIFYSLPLDQIFDINSIDKGLKQSSSSTENSLTVMLGTNIDGSEKLTPLIVGKHDKLDVSQSSFQSLKNNHHNEHIMNKLTETYRIFYKSNINKWITSTMFQNYLLTLDHKLSNGKKRKILIILDDSSSHRILNLKFENIKLVYLKNNTSHKSPFNSLYNGVNFDYLPMNFGIVQEFKILYRLQQYLEMIKVQRNLKSDKPLNNLQMNNSSTDVLSESDYNIPIIKAIEWIRRSWDAVLPEKILSSWKRTHLININQSWPQDGINLMIQNLSKIDLETNYKKLSQVIGYLNVVLPWQVDDLLGLVNERTKATLNYISIEEIVTSCLSESQIDSDNDYQVNQLDNFFNINLNSMNVLENNFNGNYNNFNEFNENFNNDFNENVNVNNVNTTNVNIPKRINPELDTMSISALLAAADEMKEDLPTQLPNQVPHLQSNQPVPIPIPSITTQNPLLVNTNNQLPTIPEINQTQTLKRKLSSVSNEPVKKYGSPINDSLPSSSTPSPYNGTIPMFSKKLYSGITFKSSSSGNLTTVGDRDLIKYLSRVVEAANLDQVKFSDQTINELKLNLSTIKNRYDKRD